MKLRDFLLKATYDDILLETPDNIEICLIRSEVHAVDLLSDIFLNSEVLNICINDCIENTIVVHIEVAAKEMDL